MQETSYGRDSLRDPEQIAVPAVGKSETANSSELVSRLSESAVGKISVDHTLRGESAKSTEEQLTSALENTKNRIDEIETNGMYPAEDILSYSNKLAVPQVSVTRRPEVTIVSMRLTQPAMEELVELVARMPTEDARYEYQSVDGNTSSIADTWKIQLSDTCSAHIVKDTTESIRYDTDFDRPISFENGEATDWEVIKTHTNEKFMTVDGVVCIEVGRASNANDEATEVRKALGALHLNSILNKENVALKDNYKEAQYRWQHDLSEEEWQGEREHFYTLHGSDLAAHLKIEEVYPGYSTVVDKGASERYEAEGPFTLIHAAHNLGALPSILRHGLLSMDEMYKRGLFTENKIGSGGAEFSSGGALGVYLRAWTVHPGSGEKYIKDPTLIIDPSVLDRTDWFAYTDDKYGSLEPEEFVDRSVPKEFFKQLHSSDINTTMNEIVVHRAIPPESITGIYVLDRVAKSELIGYLHKQGVYKVNNTPIEQFIRHPEKLSPGTENMRSFYKSFS